MQIHYRPHGDDNVAQLKLLIFIVLPDLEGERVLSRPFFPYFEHQVFLIKPFLSSKGIPKCLSL